MRRALRTGQGSPDVLIVISCWAVGQAARGEGGNEVVRELDRIVAAMKATEHDQFAFHELDAEFHTVAVRSLGNELADLLFEGCRETLRRLILAGISDTPDAWVAIHERLVHEHCQIVQAVNDGDPATAESLMREHVTVWSARAVAAAAAQGLTLR